MFWFKFDLNLFLKVLLVSIDSGKGFAFVSKWIWVRSRNCSCLVTWFCYQLIAKPGNKTTTVSWPDPYDYFVSASKFLFGMLLYNCHPLATKIGIQGVLQYEISTKTHNKLKSRETSLAYNLLYNRLNSLRPRQNRRHIADDVFKCNFLNENVWIPIKISRKFVPKGPINNIPTLVQVIAWRRSGDKPLSEPMMAQFNDVYICVIRPQWVKFCSEHNV